MSRLVISRRVGQSAFIGDKKLKLARYDEKSSVATVIYNETALHVTLKSTVVIGDDVSIWINTSSREGALSIAICAPRDLTILRGELVWEQ